MSAPVERNDPCPCGSGKKYKHCCANKRASALPKSRRGQVPFWIFMLALAGAAVATVRWFAEKGDAGAGPFTAAPFNAPIRDMGGPPLTQKDPDTGLYPPPVGPPPQDKIWSPEHGHWHDAPAGSGALPDATKDSITGLYAPPLGPPPAGKVWSAQHGQWHDTPASAGTALPGATANPETGTFDPPPGPAPDGKVWSPEHGHWHTDPATITRTVTTKTARPALPFNRTVAGKIQQEYRPYDLPASAELMSLLPPPQI